VLVTHTFALPMRRRGKPTPLRRVSDPLCSCDERIPGCAPGLKETSPFRPSPVATGEGGAAAPGEGHSSATRTVVPRTRRAGQAQPLHPKRFRSTQHAARSTQHDTVRCTLHPAACTRNSGKRTTENGQRSNPYQTNLKLYPNRPWRGIIRTISLNYARDVETGPPARRRPATKPEATSPPSFRDASHIAQRIPPPVGVRPREPATRAAEAFNRPPRIAAHHR
jgi:hypothetical protein